MILFTIAANFYPISANFYPISSVRIAYDLFRECRIHYTIFILASQRRM
ncbi:hypothetical protein OROHE_010396 [Orobanche hederae]